MKRILVGVDGSEIANATARFAAGLARATGAELLLACAVEPPIFFGADATAELVAQQYEGARAQTASVLADTKALLAREGATAATVEMEGPAATALADLAASREVDLVVVGHRSRGAVARAILGSVADRLVQISPRPVLIYR